VDPNSDAPPLVNVEAVHQALVLQAIIEAPHQTDHETNGISGVSSGLASVEAVGIASFACLDRHGRVRDFAVANAHVVPSCPDVLIGTCADAEGFEFDGPNETLALPDGAQCWVPKGPDGLYSMPAVVTSGNHSQAQRLAGSRTEELAVAFDSHRMVQSSIAASVGSGNMTHIAEMYGGLGTPSRVLSGVAVPIAYLDSDQDASDVFGSPLGGYTYVHS
jgi:hypothetical protein